MWIFLWKRIFSVVVTGLLLLILLVWIGQRIHLGLVRQEIELRQEEAIAAAQDLILSDFEEIQGSMQVAASKVLDLVRRYPLPFKEAPSTSLIQDLEGILVSDRWSLSVYDQDMQLIAWQGESIPLALGAWTDQTQWRIARDDDWREALVLWEPFMMEDSIVGRVRVTQNLFSRAPVRNSVLDDYDIVDTWRRRTGLDVQVIYGETTGEYILPALDGQPLGSYRITPPIESNLIASTATFYNNLIALAAGLLSLWLLWGIWRWYHIGLRLSRLIAFAAALGAGRIVWLYLEIPARYQTGKAPLSPLFDPRHLASTLGDGLMRTTGDLFLSALCVFILGMAVVRYAHAQKPVLAERPRPGVVWARLWIGVLAGLVLVCLLAVIIHASVLDSTLNYTGRSVLVPGSLELMVYTSLILVALGMILIVSGVLSSGFKLEPKRMIGICGTGTILVIILLDWLDWCPLIVSFGFMVVCFYVAIWVQKGDLYAWLTIRRAIPAMLVICFLLYPIYYDALNDRKRDRVAYAARTFDQVGTPDVYIAVREVIEEARQRPEIQELLASGGSLVSEAEELLRGSLLSSLGAYDAQLIFLSSEGEEIYSTGRNILTPEATQDLLVELSAGIELQTSNYTFVEPQATGETRYQYAGLAGVGDQWILVLAQPHIVSEEANTPLLRILSASGYLNLYEDLSLASYRNGQLMRTFGDRFAKYQLDPQVAQNLIDQQSLWRQESRNGRSKYLTYYLQRGDQIVAVRMTTDGAFDHLYYLLRLVVGGLLLCIPFCTFGYVIKWKAGLIPQTRLRYQDKVMNAFFLLGVIAVIPVGIAGYNVVAEENEKAVQSWLRQHLERVESTLVPEGRTGEGSVAALERSNIDSLSGRVGLDLNLYRGTQLVAASRRQLIDDRIVDKRLPAEVFHAIYGNAERFTFVEHKLGEFEYTAGYRAILDANGYPAYVLSVPALPEAERIEEERARTLAYLFGAMLGLGILVMFTGSVLARALARPIARLQQGMQEVAQGKFERVLPVESRDEIGALVKTFNTMQGQLSESREQLARQQRQLAWREMARQIAHEIKNPLTPMKLAIQHLQRSYGNKDEPKFKTQFQRTTATLIAQIDSLAHIANEFSSFARLPKRNVRTLDLRAVLSEAHALMRAEASAEVTLKLELPQVPLPVQGDLSELRRTYINLIKNALEAVQEQDPGKITVTARQDVDQIVTEVMDNGTGIPVDVQDRIYEPSFSTKTSGAGLGLAIAKQAIELSGGEISFTTQLAKGTTMRITFPVSQQRIESD